MGTSLGSNKPEEVEDSGRIYQVRTNNGHIDASQDFKISHTYFPISPKHTGTRCQSIFVKCIALILMKMQVKQFTNRYFGDSKGTLSVDPCFTEPSSFDDPSCAGEASSDPYFDTNMAAATRTLNDQIVRSIGLQQANHPFSGAMSLPDAGFSMELDPAGEKKVAYGRHGYRTKYLV